MPLAGSLQSLRGSRKVARGFPGCYDVPWSLDRRSRYDPEYVLGPGRRFPGSIQRSTCSVQSLTGPIQ
jgi:hypothetical protein